MLGNGREIGGVDRWRRGGSKNQADEPAFVIERVLKVAEVELLDHPAEDLGHTGLAGRSSPTQARPRPALNDFDRAIECSHWLRRCTFLFAASRCGQLKNAEVRL